MLIWLAFIFYTVRPRRANEPGAFVPNRKKEVISMAQSKAEYPHLRLPGARRDRGEDRGRRRYQGQPAGLEGLFARHVRRRVHRLRRPVLHGLSERSHALLGAPSASWAVLLFAWDWCSCSFAARNCLPATRLWSARLRAKRSRSSRCSRLGLLCGSATLPAPCSLSF